MPINDYKTNPYYYLPGVVPVEGGKFGYSQNENTQRDYVNGQ